jgi:copper chaperone CopZ
LRRYLRMESGLEEHLTLKSSRIKGDKDRDRLESDLSGIDGVRDVEVDPSANTVDIAFDPTIVNATRLQAAVEEAGYTLDATGDRSDEGEAGAFLGSEMTGADRASTTDTAESGADVGVGAFGREPRDVTGGEGSPTG